MYLSMLSSKIFLSPVVIQMNDQFKNYVHLLNSTLTATERTLCCILENYQTPEGVRVPDVLKPFMLGMDFLPFVNAPTNDAKPKKALQSKVELSNLSKLHLNNMFGSQV